MSLQCRCEEFSQVNLWRDILQGLLTHEASMRITGLFLIVCQFLGQPLFVDAVIKFPLHTPLAGERVRHLKGFTLVDGLALEYLKGLVGQFGTDGAAHVAVLFALVLVEHTDDTAVLVLGECHEMFHDERRLHRVVDVGHEVLDTIEDDDVGLEHADGHINHLLAPVETETTEVEGIELCVVERFDVCQRHDSVFQDLLRALLTLFGVNPKHLQRLFAQSFEGE